MYLLRVTRDAVGAVHAELVQTVDRETGPEQLPYPGGAQHPHRGVVAGPAVELADQTEAFGVGRPHGERHPGDDTVGRGERAGMGAKDLPESLVAAFAEEMQV